MIMQKDFLNILIINRTAKGLKEPGHKRHAIIKTILQKHNVNVDIVCSNIDYVNNQKNKHANQDLIQLKLNILQINTKLLMYGKIHIN